MKEIFSDNIQGILPHRAPSGAAIFVFKTSSWNTSKFDADDIFRANMMCLEKAIVDEATQKHGIAAIMDLEGFSFSHFRLITPNHTRRIIALVQDCFPARFRDIHIVNEPTLFGVLFNLLKPFLNEKLKNRRVDLGKRDSGWFFVDDPEGDLLDISALPQFSDLDHSSGLGSDDEDTTGSGDGPEGSGGIIIEETTKPILVTPENKPPKPSWHQPIEYPTKKPDPTKKPVFFPKKDQPTIKVTTTESSHKNRIPDITNPPTPVVIEPRRPENAPVPGFDTTPDGNREDNEIHIMGQKQDEKPSSFFAQPGILASVIGGAVVSLLCTILLVMFIVYRMRKKDEGSYIVGDNKGIKGNSYGKGNSKEIFA
ncbi:uncharacterized protein LOC143233524 isoform X2 [Tachypleus tridentatus]